MRKIGFESVGTRTFKVYCLTLIHTRQADIPHKTGRHITLICQKAWHPSSSCLVHVHVPGVSRSYTCDFGILPPYFQALVGETKNGMSISPSIHDTGSSMYRIPFQVELGFCLDGFA